MLPTRATTVARMHIWSIARAGITTPMSRLIRRRPPRSWSTATPGKYCEASNPDALRHPASLTKVMTLYLLFQRLEAGKLRLDTPLRVSEHAAEQDPTKLGLKPGQTITVEDAIKGIVTRSANDAAVVIAENLGGDEKSFARMMTQEAHALGHESHDLCQCVRLAG